MKFFKKVIVTFTFLLSIFIVKAQSVSEILKNPDADIHFYGIDFSKTKLIGDATANAEEIVLRQFAGINDLFLNEQKKYNIAKAFNRNNIDINLDAVSKINKKINAAKLLSNNTEDYAVLSEKDIQNAVKALSIDKKSGTGIVFIADGMSKAQKAISLWVTIFDVKTKKILLTERMEGKLGAGFSFRNYWATGIKKIVDQIGAKKYKEWTK